MLSKDRIKGWKLHPSQRGIFSLELYKQMAKNEDIVLILPDLGWKQFDAHCEDFPDRVFKFGASEQAAIGIAIGMALKGKIPFVYSITNFILYRPFEWIRYLDHESIHVNLVGAGRDKDYADDGYSHESEDAKSILANFHNITKFWPTSNIGVARVVKKAIENKAPSFISLTRK